MHSRGPSSLRIAHTRRCENDDTHTRSMAPIRRSRPANGCTPFAFLTSRLSRTSGQRSSTSESNGIGSWPLILAFDTSDQGRSAILPVRSVTRSRLLSWNATTTPSLVACTSVSRYR